MTTGVGSGEGQVKNVFNACAKQRALIFHPSLGLERENLTTCVTMARLMKKAHIPEAGFTPLHRRRRSSLSERRSASKVDEIPPSPVMDAEMLSAITNRHDESLLGDS